MATKLPATISISEAPLVELHLDYLTFAAQQPVKTLSIATRGMLNFGQKEMVLCLKQYSNDYIKTAVDLFRLLLDMAAKGQLVDVNGLSEFGSNGIFNNPRFTGIGYVRSHSIEPVLDTLDVKNHQTLSMVLLTSGEVEVMKCYGLARILSRICADSRYFPYPLWNDMDRQEVLGREDLNKCYLKNFQLYPGIVAVREENTVQVYFDRKLAQTLVEGFTAHPAGIFATEIVPGAIDGLLVWRPESDHIVVNTPRLFAVSPDGLNPDETVRSLAGCYIVIGHDPENRTQGVEYSEDGFYATLDLQGWVIFMDALRSQEPCMIESRNRSFHFGVGWMG